MKAAAFSYARATSVANAIALLAQHGERAKVLSGGQSLTPAMNLRLITPELIVDIGALDELRGTTTRDGLISIGALTRQSDLQQAAEIEQYAPLLKLAAADIAHPAIRNRGTIGGSLAHADPAAELPACMVALNATIVVRGEGRERRIPAANFFGGIYETAMTPQELLVAVELPLPRKNAAHFFREFARRRGDFAIVGLAAQAALEGGRILEFRPVFFGVSDRPILSQAATGPIGKTVTPEIVSKSLQALSDELEPPDDQAASAAMRRHLTKVLLRRCVAELLGRPELNDGGKP